MNQKYPPSLSRGWSDRELKDEQVLRALRRTTLPCSSPITIRRIAAYIYELSASRGLRRDST